MNKLFYEVENEYFTLRGDYLDYENIMTLKEFLDIGFYNSYIFFDKRYEVGYKYNDYLSGVLETKYSSDFSLNEKQLNCKVQIEDWDYDNDNFTIVYLKLVNESDKKYFINEEGECL